MIRMDLTVIYRTFHSIKKNIPSSQHTMETSLKLITYSVTKTTLTDKKSLNILLFIIGSPQFKVKIEQQHKKPISSGQQNSAQLNHHHVKEERN